MAAKQNSKVNDRQATSEDIPRTSLEKSLLCQEKLDRASPELWPKQIPGVSKFANLQNTNQSPPPWEVLTKEDHTYMQQLGSLSTNGLIKEVKRLHDLAYQLEIEEKKELARGKYLNIFSSKQNRSNSKE